MKKSLAKKITLSILAGAVLMSSSVVWAAVPSGWNEVIDVGYVRDSSTNADGTVPVGNHEKRFYGAYDSGNNNVTHGKVKITGGSVSGYNIRVYGGHSSSGDATDNEVTITGGTVGTSEHKIAIYGGYSSDCAATGNKVDISGNSSITGYVYGGYSYGNTASGNTVTIRSSSNVTGEVYGGRSGSKNNTGVELEKRKSTNNTVEIYGGTINGSVYGGQSMYEGASATGNTVTISGGTISGDETEKVKVSGGWSSNKGEVSSNTVIISGESEIKDADVYGGWSQAGKTTGNTVTISGVSKVENTNIYGGYSFPYGLEGGGDATGNTVTISSGTFTDTIVQGGGVDGIGNATNNTVIISGGTFTGEIYGGKTVNGGSVDSYKATGNTVNISGNAVLENAELYGGYVINNSCYGGATNANTLNIGVDDELQSQLDTKGITVDVGAWNNKKVKSIQGFDVINFAYVNWEKDGTVVEVTDKLALNNTKIKVGTVNVAGGTTLANGDKMALISATGNGVIEGNISNSDTVAVCEGVANVYKGYVKQISKSILLELGDGPEGEYTVPDDDSQGGGDQGDGTGGGTGDGTTGDGTTGGTSGGNTGGDQGNNDSQDGNGNQGTGGVDGGTGDTPTPERNDQVLVLGESRAAAVAFTNQGSELIELGLNALARDNSKDTKVFAAVYGNHSEYETGSHVNVNGWSGIVGIGKTNANGLTVGAFFENGEGNYSTHNDYNAQYIRGDGEANYNGGGLLVRKDNANGVYAEAYLRAGNLQNELRNAVRNGQDLTGYDVDTFYYGAHIGIGKVIPRGADGDSLDVYGKFIYTHHDGETFDVGGTPTKFDSVESERLRLGFRLNEVQTNKLSMYYGAAWEYEFNGDAHDKIASFDLETPSLEGSTVIGEIGMHYKASEKWSLDLNARAYTGQREGFSGSVQANYSF